MIRDFARGSNELTPSGSRGFEYCCRTRRIGLFQHNPPKPAIGRIADPTEPQN
jgi:hypothetical protein